jgi:hypothetical protein
VVTVFCPNCGQGLIPEKCKQRCKCGFFESCSDLEPALPLSGLVGRQFADKIQVSNEGIFSRHRSPSSNSPETDQGEAKHKVV